MPLTRDGHDDLAPPDHEAAVLVCGLCERVLPGRYQQRGEADEFADVHVEEEHPDHRHVVVIPASEGLVAEDPGELISIAANAQAKVLGEGRQDT